MDFTEKRKKISIRRLLEENINKKVNLVLKKKECDNSFEREVAIVSVGSKWVVGKGVSGMEWPYAIDDDEMEILRVESCK